MNASLQYLDTSGQVEFCRKPGVAMPGIGPLVAP